MNLSAAPTLVVGAGPAAAAAVAAVGELLALYEPRVAPITALAGGDPAPTAAELRAALEGALSETNLQRVREGGLEVGAAGFQRAHVLVILDGAAPAAAEAALAAVREAVAAVPLALPARVAVVALAPGATAGQVGLPLAKWLAVEVPNAARCGVVVLDRYRSDGSTLTRTEVEQALAVLAFTGLLPWSGEGHWLFTAMPAEVVAYTLGVGLLRVPLGEIHRALAHRLAADALPAAGDAADAAPFVAGLGLSPALAERGMWNDTLASAPVVLPEGGEPFQVRLTEGQARAALGEGHWREWDERLAEFDAEWGTLVAEEWLANVRRAAQAALEKRLTAVDAALDAAVGSGRGLLRRAEGVLSEAERALAAWECAAPRYEPSVIRRDLTPHRKALHEALQAMPNGWAAGYRAALACLATAVVGLGATRAAVEMLGANGLAVGAVALAVVAGLAWKAGADWSAARNRVLKARQEYLEAITEKYASLLRATGLVALRAALDRLQGHVKQRRVEVERIGAEFAEAEQRQRERGADFSPTVSPVVRSFVEANDLPAVARALWGSLDLEDVLRDLLRAGGMARFVPLLPPLDAEPGTHLSGAIEGPALARVRGAGWDARLRTLGFYLNLRRAREGDAADRWLAGEVRALEAQADRALWPRVDGFRQVWQVLPPEPDVAAPARAAHAGGGPETEVPGLVGTLVLRQVGARALEGADA